MKPIKPKEEIFMLNENLKSLRKAKGLSQEVLAERLHVVRQTISKWEKGLSVPDADMLIRISEILDTSVSTLLGSTTEITPTEKDSISIQLEQLNTLFAEKQQRSRRIWKIVGIVLIVMTILTILQVVLGYAVNIGTKDKGEVTDEKNVINEFIE
jgi:putative transcriptional regulator